MSTDTQLLTVADYAALEGSEDDHITELVRGVVVREPRPRRQHGRIQVELASRLNEWARTHGAEVTAESGYVLSDDPATVRGPDVGVIVDPRAATEVLPGWVRGAPDVVVEVVSPSDSAGAINQKAIEYLEAGARLVWIVDPDARTVMVHRPDGTANLLREHDVLSGEEVLAGFAVELGAVFERTS